MKRVLMYLAVGAFIVTGVLMMRRPVATRVNEFLSDRATIAADTGDPSSAIYQRQAASREAVFAMQEELRSLARAESAFIADSGRPTVYLPATYPFRKGEGNLGPYIRIERNGWGAMIQNSRTSMRCTLFAALDTATGNYHPGQPDCRAASGEAWDAVAVAQAPSRTAEPSSPVVDPPQGPPVPAPRQPRPSRDWGPINNTPPPKPYIARNACEGEGCTTSGLWAACGTIVVREDPRPDAPQVAVIQAGERFTALRTDVHVDVAGMIGFRDTVSNPGNDEGDTVDSVRFIPADTLYILNYRGEGYLVWWYRGRAARGYQFWDDSQGSVGGPASVVVLREAQSTSWVHVRNSAGKEGWIVRDFYRMATGGYMDEIERCTGNQR
jgi:hypothetical protein